MSESHEPDFIFAGASRCGSTWLQNALADHPEIALTSDNPVSFFDLHYHRGNGWYERRLPDAEGETLVGESSPGYMKSPHAPERIAQLAPDVKLLFTVRNPVDRAFSEWWHERSFGNLQWDFEKTLSHHPAFDALLRPGFYNRFLSRFDDQFANDQIHVAFFEDFTADNEQFVQDAYEFLGVDSTYTPSVVGERVNEANHLSPRLNRLKSWVHHNAPTGIYEQAIRPAYQSVKGIVESDSPYKQGIPDELRAEMQAVFLDDVRALEDRTSRDLNHWVSHVEG